ncbi:MAG: hypothetical protein O3C20_07840 [Verrucomicrobia bacterium]|nr:hypothetical protein [Verrucomicrobiota bacterium]
MSPIFRGRLKSLRDRSDPVDKEELENLFAGRRRYADASTVVHSRKWTARSRIKQALGKLKLSWMKRPKKRELLTRVHELKQQNLVSKESLLHTGGPVVSMATHPRRIETTFLAIESIARGTLKPGRIILWVSGAPQIPLTLKRLEARGLEIRPAGDFGPHTKYYPYVRELSDSDSHPAAIVTADDDKFYPQNWLKNLVSFHQSNPSSIHGYNLRRMEFNKHHFEPYQDWETVDLEESNRLNYVNSSNGMIYPPELLHAVKAAGNRFQETTRTSDNTWLSYLAFKEGIKICSHKIDEPIEQIPATEKTGLSHLRTSDGSNHLQLAVTFNAEDRAALMEIQKQQLRAN